MGVKSFCVGCIVMKIVNSGSRPKKFRRREALAALAGLPTVTLFGCGGGDVPEDSGLGTAVLPTEAISYPTDEPSGPVGVRTYASSWKSSFVPEAGPIAQWATGLETGVATVQDCWGVLRTTRPGEARFWGARRVENKIRGSGDLTNGTYWYSVGSVAVNLLNLGSLSADAFGTFRACRLSKSTTNSALVQILGVLPPQAHTFSIYARAETLDRIHLQLFASGGPVAAVQAVQLSATGWTRVQITGTPDGVSSYKILISPGPFVNATAGSIQICCPQLEDVSGHPSVAASEYIETDRIRPPIWHYGAMVDGVRYFSKSKASSTANNITVDNSGGGTEFPDSSLLGLLLEPRVENLCKQTESFSSWTRSHSSVAVRTASAVSPRMDRTAAELLEGTHSGLHATSSSIGMLSPESPVTFSCFAKAGGRGWLRMQVTLSTGSEVIAYFDLVGGQVGSVVSASNRSAWAHIESWRDGWFRCILTTQNYSTGVQVSKVTLATSKSNGVGAYAGEGLGIFIWGAQASSLEFASSYIPNEFGSASVTRAAQSVEVMNPGGTVLGLNSYTIALDVRMPYYSGIDIKGGAIPTWRAFFSAFASGYYRDQHRLAMGLRPYSDTVFGDRYLGDPNPLYQWKANKVYPLGSFVIPTDTQVDNRNNRKMFTCVVAGSSGSMEPVWNSVFTRVPDTITNSTIDGGVVWQVNHVDFDGKWQPFDTSHLDRTANLYPTAIVTKTGLRTDKAAAGLMRCSYFSAPGAYGVALNGESMPRDTDPFPIDGTPNGDLHQYMESIRFGRMSETMTTHPSLLRNVSIGRENIDAETNRLRTQFDMTA